jgi:signal peptidase I
MASPSLQSTPVQGLDREHLREAAALLIKWRRDERDRMPPKVLEDLEALLSRIEAEADQPALPRSPWWHHLLPELCCRWISGSPVPLLPKTEELLREVEALSKRVPPTFSRFPAWAENLDVILFALVIAMGIRTYFLQPFKIPTNSMFPSLRGVVVTLVPAEQRHPGPLGKVAGRLLLGRSYLDFTLPEGAVFMGERTSGFFLWRKVTLFYKAADEILPISLWTEAEVRDIVDRLGLPRFIGDRVKEGQHHFKAIVDTGDHVFVNKVIYHIRRPQRSEPFVFRTAGMAVHPQRFGPEEQQGSQYYIKRCVGLPGDELRVNSPVLEINGHAAAEPSIRRVWLGGDTNPAYRGYSNGNSMRFLRTPQDRYVVPDHCYWAMGDNSYNSLDSRYIGPVPEENLVGRALVVYYPFNRFFHWID